MQLYRLYLKDAIALKIFVSLRRIVEQLFYSNYIQRALHQNEVSCGRNSCSAMRALCHKLYKPAVCCSNAYSTLNLLLTLLLFASLPAAKKSEWWFGDAVVVERKQSSSDEKVVVLVKRKMMTMSLSTQTWCRRDLTLDFHLFVVADEEGESWN